MIAYSRGDVVLVNFMYTDQSGRKLRPALIVSSAAFHTSRQDVIVAGITSNVTRRLIGDYQLVDWQTAGLVVPSTVTGILQTIQRTMLGRLLGTLAPLDLQAYDQQLRQSLAL
jgi:mRNA interferase MazF